jgi:hypothetical protein
MKDIFSDTASTPARPGDDTNNTRRRVITPDGDRGDDDDKDELSKLTQLDEPHSPEQQIVVEKRRYFVPEIIKERNKKCSQTAVALDSRNVILPLQALVDFLTTNFCCKRDATRTYYKAVTKELFPLVLKFLVLRVESTSTARAGSCKVYSLTWYRQLRRN